MAGALAATLLALALLDERLLEAQLGGRALVWYGALLGTLLAASRGVVGSAAVRGAADAPEAAMEELAVHTHWLPRRWRGRAHTARVQAEFDGMFANTSGLFAEEMLSVFLTPMLLWGALPRGAPEIIAFVRDFTAHVEGVGHVW